MTEINNTSAHRNTPNEAKIAFIGAGNMASAILRGLLQAGWPNTHCWVSNPSQGKLDTLHAELGVPTTTDNRTAAATADIIVLSVKPQKLPEVCHELAAINLQDKLVISIAAGFPCDKIELGVNQSISLVRAMPNTPALIKQGASALFATPSVSPAQRQLSESIFQAVGEVTWLDDEAQMDTVTAIAGSSPAYVFLLMQAMVEQAQVCGLDAFRATQLVTQAVSGAAQLAQFEREKTLQQLREAVTSPGGTTAAALASFALDDFSGAVKRAVQAAFERGRELGRGEK